MQKKEYEKFKKLVKKLTKNNELSDDLLHDIFIELKENEKFNTLSEKDRVYFFIRVIKNQFYSNNSKFQRTYKKYRFDELPVNYDLKDEEYIEHPTIDWIKETLDKELELNKDFWYNHGIFNMYLEHKKIKTLHVLTKIPIYSIRATIKEIKVWLKEKWDEYKQ